MLLPAAWPESLSFRWAALINPIIGIACCCAGAASGHEAAAPQSLVWWRRAAYISPRVVGGQVMTPADLKRLHK